MVDYEVGIAASLNNPTRGAYLVQDGATCRVTTTAWCSMAPRCVPSA